jgi:hypothetical protein
MQEPLGFRTIVAAFWAAPAVDPIKVKDQAFILKECA